MYDDVSRYSRLGLGRSVVGMFGRKISGNVCTRVGSLMDYGLCRKQNFFIFKEFEHVFSEIAELW